MDHVSDVIGVDGTYLRTNIMNKVGDPILTGSLVSHK